MDYFDPHSDAYLLTELVYKNLFNLRESVARRLDVNKKEICSDPDLLVIAKCKP